MFGMKLIKANYHNAFAKKLTVKNLTSYSTTILHFIIPRHAQHIDFVNLI